MILERFDAVVFVGDDTLQAVYAGLNILLRQDLALGALEHWNIAEDVDVCRCENQFLKESCWKNSVSSSEQVQEHTDNSKGSSYACTRTTHAFLSVNSSPAAPLSLAAFKSLVPKAPPSVFKPIPIIHSVTSDASTDVASKSLDEFLALADASKRKTPMLWVGPPAAGHLDIRGRKANQDIWRFSDKMTRAARERDVESLGLWNMTVQANSWNGKGFGENVAIVQAMMVSLFESPYSRIPRVY